MRFSFLKVHFSVWSETDESSVSRSLILKTNNNDILFYPLEGEALSEHSRSVLYAISSEQLSSKDETIKKFKYLAKQRLSRETT